MELKLKSTLSEPVAAEATTTINLQQEEVFDFIASNFHENYQKWMSDVIELDMLDGIPIKKGSKVKQIRQEDDRRITSVFEIKELEFFDKLSFEGLDMPYRQIYSITPAGPETTRLTFRFELLEVELLMRPFVKLIRAAISEGVESSISALNELLTQKENTRPLQEI